MQNVRKTHPWIMDIFKYTMNRHYPKLRNRHGNIHSAILNGATMLTTVW